MIVSLVKEPINEAILVSDLNHLNINTKCFIIKVSDV